MQKVCNEKKKDRFQQSGKCKASGSGEQRNRRVQLVDQGKEDDGNIMILNVEGDEKKPDYMEGFINGNKFEIMIDSGSPVTIFALDEIKQITKRETQPVREMIEGKRYVDFNSTGLCVLRTTSGQSAR